MYRCVCVCVYTHYICVAASSYLCTLVNPAIIVRYIINMLMSWCTKSCSEQHTQTHTHGVLNRGEGWGNTTDPISSVWKVHLHIGIIGRVSNCHHTHAQTHTFKYSVVCFSRSEVETHGRICSWCILKQTKPGSNSTHTHAQRYKWAISTSSLCLNQWPRM